MRKTIGNAAFAANPKKKTSVKVFNNHKHNIKILQRPG